ncbi:hypothetical protein Salat_2695200 [Sesamum alatum]|uniref:Uncharacterized protein n=1 Tax=Sesamum alatum TaxID=300844 RepID=A0AAE2CBA2_9LAMI|nr:hypothetical protein Salat_2695200 [Sesamum alatum]
MTSTLVLLELEALASALGLGSWMFAYVLRRSHISIIARDHFGTRDLVRTNRMFRDPVERSSTEGVTEVSASYAGGATAAGGFSLKARAYRAIRAFIAIASKTKRKYC